MFSNDLEGGYPGNLTTVVKYTLNQNNELIIEICSKSDKDTIYNPTSHSYFNLNPSLSSILNHKLKINSTKYIPVNEECIPTGKQENSKNTPFDFSLEKEIGKEINNDNKQLRNGNGYDHCYVLNTNNHISAELSDQISGRKLMITTDQPGIQLYSGNHLRGKFIKNEGVCLEAQHFPDSPNNKTFPSTILKANEEYYTKTIYSFGII
jgi:aldose 1-epimerase